MQKESCLYFENCFRAKSILRQVDSLTSACLLLSLSVNALTGVFESSGSLFRLGLRDVLAEAHKLRNACMISWC